MKKLGMLLSGLLLITATATSWGQDLSARNILTLQTELSALRQVADDQRANCDFEGESGTADLLQDVSARVVGLNLRLGGTIKTKDQYRSAFATEILPLKDIFRNNPDLGTCEPSVVVDKIQEMAGTGSGGVVGPLGPRGPRD